MLLLINFTLSVIGLLYLNMLTCTQKEKGSKCCKKRVKPKPIGRLSLESPLVVVQNANEITGNQKTNQLTGTKSRSTRQGMNINQAKPENDVKEELKTAGQNKVKTECSQSILKDAKLKSQSNLDKRQTRKESKKSIKSKPNPTLSKKQESKSKIAKLSTKQNTEKTTNKNKEGKEQLEAACMQVLFDALFHVDETDGLPIRLTTIPSLRFDNSLSLTSTIRRPRFALLDSSTIRQSTPRSFVVQHKQLIKAAAATPASVADSAFSQLLSEH